MPAPARVRSVALATALFASVLTPVPIRWAQEADPILNALETELRRSADGLSGGERPAYFVGYQLRDRWGEQVSAQNGAVFSASPQRTRYLDVDVRVGSHRFDNTHRVAGPRPGLARVPVEDDPGALRSAVWLATEGAYRRAVETLIRLEGQRSTTATQSDTSPDFARVTPLTRIDAPPPPLSFDRAAWQARVGRWASRLTRRPEIHGSRIQLTAEREVVYIVTNEGTRVRAGLTAWRLLVLAETRADDGMDLELSRIFHASTPDGLPSDETVMAAVDSLGAELSALRTAPVVDPSAGPAILSARASAVFFHEVVGHRLEGHRQKDERFGQTFTARLGEPVLPTFLSMVDDPTRRTHSGIELAGHYVVDDEGVPAQPAPLVRKGLLAGFLMGRSPIAPAPVSNGHGRRQVGFDAVARQGVLIVESERSVAPADLRARLLEEIRRQQKPYGFYFDEIEGGFTLTGRGGPQAFKVLPLVVYRVYSDGRPDELVRGVNIVGTPLTVLSKILATDNRYGVFNGFCGAESGSIPVSAASPALLVSEIEVEKGATSQARPPILTAPTAISGRPNELFAALEDELARNRDSLRLPDFAPPYYVAYRVDDFASHDVEATLGALTRNTGIRGRSLEMDLRVGSPREDNTSGFGGGSQITPLPLDGNYIATRRQAWRTADERYRRATASLAGRRAQQAGQADRDSVPAFSPADPHVRRERPVALELPDTARSTQAARAVSRVFRDFPLIDDSRVRVEVARRNRYFLSSEGSRSIIPGTSASVLIAATARGPSGLTVTDHRFFTGAGPADLPSTTVLEREARALAERLSELAGADEAQGYAGPVLFEGRAAPQLFIALLGRTFSAGRTGAAGSESPIERRLLRRILPPGYQVVDDPTRTEYAGTPLFGHYVLDDEGMPPKAVTVVENGVLKTLPMSRTPSKRVRGSTGHGRSTSSAAEPRAAMANLIVEPPAAGAVDAAALRRQLLALAADMGQDHALIVRSLQERGPPVMAGLALVAGAEGGSQLAPPIDAVLISADGKERPVRGLAFEEVALRALRDIVAAGREPVVYNFGLDGLGVGQRGRFGASAVTPAVLVEDMELRATTRREKPPVLAHPLFERTGHSR